MTTGTSNNGPRTSASAATYGCRREYEASRKRVSRPGGWTAHTSTVSGNPSAHDRNAVAPPPANGRHTSRARGSGIGRRNGSHTSSAGGGGMGRGFRGELAVVQPDDAVGHPKIPFVVADDQHRLAPRFQLRQQLPVEEFL